MKIFNTLLDAAEFAATMQELGSLPMRDTTLKVC